MWSGDSNPTLRSADEAKNNRQHHAVTLPHYITRLDPIPRRVVGWWTSFDLSLTRGIQAFAKANTMLIWLYSKLMHVYK